MQQQVGHSDMVVVGHSSGTELYIQREIILYQFYFAQNWSNLVGSRLGLVCPSAEMQLLPVAAG